MDRERWAREAWIRALQATAAIGKHPAAILPREIADLAATRPDDPALIGTDGALSYRDLAARSRLYASWALRHRVAAGGVVCLVMRNCPEFVAIWLGVTSVGGIIALINSNLSGAALAYAIGVARPL